MNEPLSRDIIDSFYNEQLRRTIEIKLTKFNRKKTEGKNNKTGAAIAAPKKEK